MAPSPNATRDAVAAELDAMCASAGPLATDSGQTTVDLYYDRGAASTDRLRIVRDVIERYEARQTGIARDAKAAIITAGAPGAGKSTAIDNLALADDTYRRLDADVVKTMLIERAMADGIYADIPSNRLSDGHPVMPGELASLVHRESTIVIETIRDRAIRQEENIVIEGTLSWPGLGTELISLLASEGYHDVTILDVEVPQEVALERALDRWWTGRTSAYGRTGDLGGRFTPSAAIRSLYPSPDRSVCLNRATTAYRSSAAADLDAMTLVVHDAATGTTRTERTRLGLEVPGSGSFALPPVGSDGRGDIFVAGYTRRSGTPVPAHWRKRPTR